MVNECEMCAFRHAPADGRLRTAKKALAVGKVLPDRHLNMGADVDTHRASTEEAVKFASLSFAILVWSGTAAAQKESVVLGALTCTLGEPAESSTSEATGRTRDALCTFKPTRGTEETYTAVLTGVSVSPDERGVLIWSVRSSGTPVNPGLLEKKYTSDSRQPADQGPPMLGDANGDLTLHTMTDRKEGSASATQKPPPRGFVILSIELKLKSASG